MNKFTFSLCGRSIVEWSGGADRTEDCGAFGWSGQPDYWPTLNSDAGRNEHGCGDLQFWPKTWKPC